MLKESENRSAIRSFLPESHLKAQRDTAALHYKYKAALIGSTLGRLGTLLDSRYWSMPGVESINEYTDVRFLGDIAIEGEVDSPVEAEDDLSKAQIRYGQKDATLLHVRSITGVQYFRRQLATTVEYIVKHRQLRETELVAGVTYREVGRLATAIGFREMKVQRLKPDYETEVRAAHMAFCAINNKANEFVPAVVYLPTDEFITKFSL